MLRAVKKVQLLMKKKSIDHSWFDDMVMDAKQQEANKINNRGLEAQIEYLYKKGYTVGELKHRVLCFSKTRKKYLAAAPVEDSEETLVPLKIRRAFKYKIKKKGKKCR